MKAKAYKLETIGYNDYRCMYEVHALLSNYILKARDANNVEAAKMLSLALMAVSVALDACRIAEETV